MKLFNQMKLKNKVVATEMAKEKENPLRSPEQLLHRFLRGRRSFTSRNRPQLAGRPTWMKHPDAGR